MKGVVRAVVENQKTLMTTIQEMKKEFADWKKKPTDLSSPASCEEFLPDDTPPAGQQARVIGGRRFPLNSEADMRRFCEFWRRCEHDWIKKKKGKNYASDEEAEKALGKPEHKKMVGIDLVFISSVLYFNWIHFSIDYSMVLICSAPYLCGAVASVHEQDLCFFSQVELYVGSLPVQDNENESKRMTAALRGLFGTWVCDNVTPSSETVSWTIFVEMCCTN